MTDDRLTKFRDALTKHVDAASDLLNAFQELKDDENDAVASGYPYKESFEDVFHDLIEWNSQVRDAVEARAKAELDLEAAVQRAWQEYARVSSGKQGVAALDEMSLLFREAFRAAIRAARRDP